MNLATTTTKLFYKLRIIKQSPILTKKNNTIHVRIDNSCIALLLITRTDCLKYNPYFYFLLILFIIFSFLETLPVLIFSDTHSIGIFDTESDNVTILADGYNYILFLDYHFSKRYIFWSDYHGNTISRYNFVHMIISGRDIPK